MFRKSWVLSLNCSYQFILLRHEKIHYKHEWILPSGYDTGIKIYNRVKNDKVPLILPQKHLMKWYICGPTVYDVAHLGHASCYIRFDIIRRILERFFHLKPVVALGITDVDDKIIKKSIDKNVDFKSLTKQYEFEFFDDLKNLNVLLPNVVLRVSDHIGDIIEFIKKLIDKKYAYVVEDGNVYFDCESFGKYGKLFQIPQTGYKTLQEGQKSYLDFTLWKAYKPNEPFWESPWGKGRPGWHIECSAIGSRIFGSNLDLHSGGIDLVFPHHENEEAQSCAYHECNQWVNYWLHAGSLDVKNQKMSKSLLNFVSIKDFLKSHNSDTFRMFCFLSHYRKGLNYDDESLNMASDACKIISKFLFDTKSYIKGQWVKGNISESELLQKLEETEKNILTKLSNDFDTGSCFHILMDLMKTTLQMMNEQCILQEGNKSPDVVAAVSQYIEKTFEGFGFKFNLANEFELNMNENKIEFIIDSITNFRQIVREEALCCADKKLKGSLLKACDQMRNDLECAGIGIQDQSNNASSWGKIKANQKK